LGIPWNCVSPPLVVVWERTSYFRWPHGLPLSNEEISIVQKRQLRYLIRLERDKMRITAFLAKSMVTLSSMFVLSEYWSSEVGQHSFGKLRVRGVQIRYVLSMVLDRRKCQIVGRPPTPPCDSTEELHSILAPSVYFGARVPTHNSPTTQNNHGAPMVEIK